MNRNDLLEETIVLSNEYLDDALLGVDQDGIAIYDYDLLIELFMENENWTEEEAADWIDYNIASTREVRILYRY